MYLVYTFWLSSSKRIASTSSVIKTHERTLSLTHLHRQAGRQAAGVHTGHMLSSFASVQSRIAALGTQQIGNTKSNSVRFYARMHAFAFAWVCMKGSTMDAGTNVINGKKKEGEGEGGEEEGIIRIILLFCMHRNIGCREALYNVGSHCSQTQSSGGSSRVQR